MSYRDRQDIYAPPSKSQHSRVLGWTVLGLMITDLAPLLGIARKDYGVHASRLILPIAAIAIGVLCVVGGVTGFRDARRSPARHVAALTGESPGKLADGR